MAERLLNLEQLHETAQACCWANNFLTHPQSRIEAEKSREDMESYMDSLTFHFGVWKSNKRPDLAIETVLIYAYEEGHTHYFKYEDTERAEAADKCLAHECLGKTHDAESLDEAIDNFYDYFPTCKTDYSLAENKWSSSYGLTWALLVRWHFEVFDIIECFSGIVKKFKKFQKKQQNEKARQAKQAKR